MNQPKSRIVPLSPDHARRLADGIEQHEASFITPKGDGWLTPTERIYIASLLRNAAASESRATVPPGWKLVPEVPTDAMLDALGNSPWIVESDTKVVGNQVITTRREHREQRYVVDGWQNMLAAAPEAPK